MDMSLSVNNLSGGYGKESVVKDVSFGVKKGDFVGIIGPNGSGKSTLFRLMTRILTPQRGNVLLQGSDIAQMNLKEFSRKVAFVPQDTLINFSFSVWEIALMGRIPHLRRLQFETKKDLAVTQKTLSLTNTLHLKQKDINELSAGERQRVIIAKALTQEPVFLFLDEPTSHLDIAYQIQILDLLRKLNKESNLTILIILHDLNLASEYCNRIILLNEGKIFKDGNLEDVLTYQNIEAVYKTRVVVNKNPISHKPYVVLVPGDQ